MKHTTVSGITVWVTWVSKFHRRNWLLAEERRRRKRKKAPQNFACQTFNEGNRSKWSNASSMLHFQHAMINSPIVNISSINSKWKTKEIMVVPDSYITHRGMNTRGKNWLLWKGPHLKMTVRSSILWKIIDLKWSKNSYLLLSIFSL